MLHALLDTGWWDPKERSWLRTFVKVLLYRGTGEFRFKFKNLRTVYCNILIVLFNMLIVIVREIKWGLSVNK